MLRAKLEGKSSTILKKVNTSMTIEDKYGGIDCGNNGHDITSVGCCDDYAFNIILDIFGLNPLKMIRLNKNYNEAL